MEPDVLSPELAVKALAMISAIPVVIHALWADYFGQTSEEVLKKNREEREPELEKIKIATILALILQFTLFLGSGDIRQVYPVYSNLIFIGSILLHLTIQSQLEKKFVPPNSQENAQGNQPEAIVPIIVRTALCWLIGLTLQILILFLSIRGGLWLGAQNHISQETSGFIALGAGIGGVALGLFLNYAFGPLYMKGILPHTPVKDPVFQEFLKSCLSKVKLDPPNFSIIELEQFRVTAVIWAGLRMGFGPFRPVLFVSRWMFNTLSLSEIEAIVLNQITHVSLRHPRKRFFLTLFLIFSTTLTALLAVALFRVVFSPQVATDFVGPLVAFLCFVSCFKVMSLQTQKHEWETDLYTVEKLGVSFEDLISALVKVDQQLQPDPSSLHPIHPEVQKRVDRIRTYFEGKQGKSLERDRAA